MSESQILLSEYLENTPPDDFKVVETEIEFLRHDGVEKLFVRGVQLCDYVRILYQARKLNFREIVSPRSRLRSLLGDTSDQISPALLKRLLEILDRESPKTLAELLFHLTHNEFWLEQPSLKHAAAFLLVGFEYDLQDLAEMQRQIWLAKNQDRQLNEIYSQEFDKREQFLQKWFFDEKTRRDLGEFLLKVPAQTSEILGEKIGQNLRKTEGAAISEFPKQTVNKAIYAQAAEDYFSHHPHRLTANKIAHLSPLLSSAQRTQFEKLLPQNEVAPLSINADFQAALDWATEIYFPFRSAQAHKEANEKSEMLADSFSDWLLENYPKMVVGDYENSLINLRTFYIVKKLHEQGFWVLWTVVDGLNFPNHQKLLRQISQKSSNLKMQENGAVFAVLPTITEKAKYGLTSGKFPSENFKNDWNVKNVFTANFPDGIYAGNSDEDKLLEGLKRENPTVCYWNYTEIDNCFHQQKSLTFIENKIDSILRGLAGNINQLVSLSKDMNRVAVVICSDHGQMMNSCRQLEIDLGNCHTHGRTALEASTESFSQPNFAYLKTNNGETVYLNPISFRLSEPTTIALGSTYFVDLKANAQTPAVGVHGGLYPEEAVIGLAVLMRESSHKKLSAEITGNGETGKAGMITLSVDNPNSVTVNPLSVTIENLALNEQGELLLAKIAAKDVKKFEIPIEKSPAPNNGDMFEIRGVLQYEFDDGTQDECSVTGTIICKSLYTAKNPSLLDRFKK